MRNLIMAGLMATSLLPAAAQAHWGDRNDARDWHDDRRDWGRDRHDRWDDDRRDRWDDRREDWREAHRGWREPRWDYGAHWIYRGDRALLIDRWGRVIRVVSRDRYWR